MNPAAKSKKRVSSLWLLPLAAIAFVCLGPLLSRLVPEGPIRMQGIVNNLRQIELMKLMWAGDHGATGSVRMTQQDLAPYALGYFSNGLPRAVAGERYIIHRLGVAPEAQLTKPARTPHGKLPAGTVIRLQPGGDVRIVLPNEQGGGNGTQTNRFGINGTSGAPPSGRSP